MNQKLKTIQKTFVISIITLVTISLVTLSSILYITNAIEIRHDVSSSKLHSLTENYPEVAAYLATQKHAEPHFIRIASLVKNDQQTLLAKALLLAGLPVIVGSGIFAFLLARKLVKPVEETFSAQERFLQDASHEMRNPLAALYAVIQEAKNTDDVRSLKNALRTLERQAQQLVKLNDDLLQLERSKTNHSNAKSQNISELLLDVIDSEYAYARQTDVTIVLKVDQNISAVIDQADWVSICRNIINNAVKYSKSGTKVTVTLSRSKQFVDFQVTDKGIGIPTDQLNKVGERFFRAHNVGRTPGTGLGMALVQQAISAYQGELRIVSKISKGTTIRVRLPIK